MVLKKRNSSSMTDNDMNLKRFKRDSELTVKKTTDRSFHEKEESATNDVADDIEDHSSNAKIVVVGLDSDGDMALARLRCLGIEMNNANLLTAEGEKRVGRIFSSNRNEKELRRERGEMLVKLFKEHPLLADSAAARRTDKNLERAQMWEKITCQVNDAFGSQLEILSVDKVKKLHSYYKTRDDSTFDSMKASGRSTSGKETDVKTCTAPRSRSESSSSEDGGFENDNATSVAILNETNVEQQFMSSVKSLSSSNCPVSLTKPREAQSPSAPIFCDGNYRLKKERKDFVVSMAEHYMERMCFNSSSRTAQVNAERNSMWLKIAKLTNDKYMGLLNPLGLEQTKKLFSNCKRRRRARLERKDDECAVAPLLPASFSTPCDESSVEQNNNFNDVPLDTYMKCSCISRDEHPKGVISGRDISIDIGELRRQLADRDTEVEQLRRKVVEQANEYRNQINSVIDVLKTVVDKVFEDARSFFGVA